MEREDVWTWRLATETFVESGSVSEAARKGAALVLGESPAVDDIADAAANSRSRSQVCCGRLNTTPGNASALALRRTEKRCSACGHAAARGAVKNSLANQADSFAFGTRS